MHNNQVRVLSAEDDDNIFYDRTTGLHRLALCNERMYRGYDRCTCHILDKRSRLFNKIVEPHYVYSRSIGFYDDSYLHLWEAKHARMLLANIATKRKWPSVGRDSVDDYEYFYGWLGDEYDPDAEVLRGSNSFLDIYQDRYRHMKYDHYVGLCEKEEQTWLKNIEEAELEEDVLYA